MSKHLFSPLSLRKLTLRNRIAVSPMCQYSSKDGFASDWHLVHLGSRAVGGAALVLSEATAVEARGRISPQDLGIWQDAHVDKLKQITAFIREQGAAAGIQLAHAGRKASTYRPWAEQSGAVPKDEGGWQSVGPTGTPFGGSYPLPQALSKADIQTLIGAFEAGAARALAAGFEVAEIHAAHGYLLHSFYSPLANTRKDDYGGSFENRTRLLREVTHAVRKVWPEDLPVFVRISATDWHEDGWTIDDSVKLAQQLKELGIDLIDCSTGGILAGISIPSEPNYQLPFAKRVKQEAGIASGAVGLITEVEQANTIIRTEQADLILMAREFLRQPYWPLYASLALEDDKQLWPPQYRRAAP